MTMQPTDRGKGNRQHSKQPGEDLIQWFDLLLKDKSINEGQYMALKLKLTKLTAEKEASKNKIVEVLNIMFKSTDIKYSDFNPRVYLDDSNPIITSDIDINVGTDTKIFVSPKTIISTITRLVFGETLAYVVNENDKIEGVKFVNEK